MPYSKLSIFQENIEKGNFHSLSTHLFCLGGKKKSSSVDLPIILISLGITQIPNITFPIVNTILRNYPNVSYFTISYVFLRFCMIFLQSIASIPPVCSAINERSNYCMSLFFWSNSNCPSIFIMIFAFKNYLDQLLFKCFKCG